MELPLIISGQTKVTQTTTIRSRFYPDYIYQIANANVLDLAHAIGAVRKADRSTLDKRIHWLTQAAGLFSWSQDILEHTVRMIGMPITFVENHLQQIPDILRSVPGYQQLRFSSSGGPDYQDSEILGGSSSLISFPEEPICYAVTPGNDPRAAAIVAANLGYLGIPFILKASSRDAIAPLVIQGLVEAGFDSNFCHLVYFDSQEEGASSKHYRLVDASQIVWTYGPREFIDQNLRFGQGQTRAYFDLSGLDESDPEKIREQLQCQSTRQLLERLHMEQPKVDHFHDKIIIRHESGNCAALTRGPLNNHFKEILFQAIRYPAICTATKSILEVVSDEEHSWVQELADFLAELVVGDPLDPKTQIGYINPMILDRLEQLIDKNRLHIKVFGGERLSPIQSRPLVVASQEDVIDFFGQEISAYLLSVRQGLSVDEGIAFLNRTNLQGPRLAVSFHNLHEDELLRAVRQIQAYAVMINKPTTELVPIFHEGNDYAHQLRKKKLVLA